ncbi:hypothetical protein U9M48_028267 [Paspalum notatum var. saurae]|uniref:Uncharacterized protein n=1 Tax=Paspalum notatum var. saurae TaxID=547442 RepID=A0AAQ3TUW6_PASNO
MEADHRATRQPQRRLNDAMRDVVKKEVLKLLHVGIIYPIQDITTRFRFTRKTRVRPPSHALMELLPTGECHLGCAMLPQQWCMISIFSYLIENIMEVFMDDFSVYGKTFDGCLENLEKVLQRCKEVDLVLNWEKCHFMVREGIVLGHRISERGIEVDYAKIEVIEQRFIKNFSYIARPLTNLLAKDTPNVFDEACLESFNMLKRALVTAPIIQPPDWNAPFEIMCHASDYAVGIVLGQTKDRKHHAISYARKTLTSPQLNYSMTEKELLAVVFAIDKFRSYLVGAKGIIYSDHAALKYLLTIDKFSLF